METQWDEWARRYRAVSTPLWDPHKRRFLQSLVKPRERVLDAGCGPGLLWSKQGNNGMLWHTAERFYYPKSARIEAIDKSNNMLELARTRQKKRLIADNIKFVHMDMANISGKYDKIFAINVLQEEDVQKKLDLFHKHLRREGRLVANWLLKMPVHEVAKHFKMHTHHNQFLVKDAAVVGQRIYVMQNWHYKHYYSEDEVTQMLHRFREIEVYDFGWHPHLRGCLTVAKK